MGQPLGVSFLHRLAQRRCGLDRRHTNGYPLTRGFINSMHEKDFFYVDPSGRSMLVAFPFGATLG